MNTKNTRQKAPLKKLNLKVTVEQNDAIKVIMEREGCVSISEAARYIIKKGLETLGATA